MASKTIDVTAPKGMTGLAVELWGGGVICAVAANWAEASCPLMVYEHNGWNVEGHGRQVADVGHNPWLTLASIVAETIEMGGDKADSDKLKEIVDHAQCI
jgi:hypothetical protein